MRKHWNANFRVRLGANAVDPDVGQRQGKLSLCGVVSMSVVFAARQKL